MNLRGCGKQTVNCGERTQRAHVAPLIADGTIDWQYAFAERGMHRDQPRLQRIGLRRIAAAPSCYDPEPRVRTGRSLKRMFAFSSACAPSLVAADTCVICRDHQRLKRWCDGVIGRSPLVPK